MDEDMSARKETLSKRERGSGGIINWKIAGIVLALVLAYYAYRHFGPHPLEGREAPTFSLATLEGGVFDMNDHLGVRPILLDFWAVWCPPCRDGLPKIAALVERYAETDLVICAVNLGDAPERAQSFLDGAGITVPVALDQRGTAADLYSVSSIPMVVLIDRNGTISKVQVGLMTEAALQKQLERIL